MAKQAKNQKKSVLDWLVPLICVVVVIGAIVGILIGPIQKGIDNAVARKTVLLESADSNVALTRPVAQTIAWLELYQSFQQSYSNYNIYKYYQSIFGESIDLSSLISESEIYWLEQNVSYMKENLGLNFYTQADVSDTSGITSDDVQNSAATFALYMASGIDTNVGSYLSSTLDSIKQYVSLAADAKAAGVTLDDEDKTNVDQSIENFQKLPEAIAFKGSLKKFIKSFVGSAVQESDIREAYELMALASKYNTIVSNKNFDNATVGDIATYVEENKDDFYTAKYLKYTTTNEALVELFKAATDKDAFIEIIVNEVLDKNYASVIAKYEQENSILAHTDEYYEDVVADALTGEGYGELITYEKDVNEPDEAIASQILTNEERSNTALYLIEGTNEVYLAWFKSASAEKSEVRLKAFPRDGIESYLDMENFRESLYADVLASIKEDKTVYTHSEDEQGIAYMDLVDEALKIVKEAVPSESTASYKTDAEEGSLEAWISEDGRKAGDVRTTVTNEEVDGEEQFKECEVEIVVSAMALNQETTVNGGYLKYDAESEANEGKSKLSGKTGIELVSAMSDLSSTAVVSSNLTEDDFEDDLSTLKDWFFSSDRKNGDVAVLTVLTETTEAAKEGEEETTKVETSYYLVCYRSTQKAWESNATTAFASKKTSDWMEALKDSVKLNEEALTKLGVDLTEDEHNHDEE